MEPASEKERAPLSRNGLLFPIDGKPEPAQTIEVAPGVLWVRMSMPFALNHINLWLVRDGEGWAVIDTGLKSDETKADWQRVVEGLPDGRGLTRLFVTHLHPDHVGLAGWFVREHDIELWMTRTDYFMCRTLCYDTGREAPPEGTRFYRAAGYGEDDLERYRKRFGMFGIGGEFMPDSYRRLVDGEVLKIGGREWLVITGGGHAPEHASFYCPELDLYISGDQVLPSISSNVSVWPTEPDADPLSEWLDACHRIKTLVPDSVLVLPSHQRPFKGLHTRLDQLIGGHEEGLTALLDLLETPKRAVDVFPALFRREITNDLLTMATGESLAHLNCLIARGLAVCERDAQGVDWYRRA